jgi:hypothetical protein
MSTIVEIENAIEQLSAPQLDELAMWFEAHRAQRESPTDAESWLKRARGAAVPDVTTSDIMALTRDEE